MSQTLFNLFTMVCGFMIGWYLGKLSVMVLRFLYLWWTERSNG